MSHTVAVLVHGAGMEPWIWDRVRPLINVDTRAPEVPSRLPGVTPADCARRIVASLDTPADARIVLVLHSLAGVLAADLATLLGARLRACVYIAAVVPGAGSTFAKALGFPARLLLPILFRFNPTGLLPSESMIRGELCGDLSAEDSARIVQRYRAEYAGLFLSPVPAPPVCRSTYVTLTDDKCVRPALQAQMLARLSDPVVVAIPSGHMAMLSRPQDIAAIINQTVASA